MPGGIPERSQGIMRTFGDIFEGNFGTFSNETPRKVSNPHMEEFALTLLEEIPMKLLQEFSIFTQELQENFPIELLKDWSVEQQEGIPFLKELLENILKQLLKKYPKKPLE